MTIRVTDRVVWPSSRGGGASYSAPAAAGGLLAAGLLGKQAVGRGANTPVDAGGPDDSGPANSNRRRFLRNAAIAGGAAWVAPAVLSFNTPAAAASGCVGAPAYLGFAEQVDIGVANSTVTHTFNVTGAPTTGNAVEHIAIGVVDHIIGLPYSFWTDPPGWTLLGYYDSDVTVPGISATGSTANWSERVRVWRRTDPLASSYPFTVTYTGNNFIPQARVVVAAFDNTAAFAGNPGEFAMQGNGVVNPYPPPASSLVQVPAISTSNPLTVVLGFAGAGNVSNNQTLTPPAGYTTVAFANSGSGFPPLWLFTQTVGGGGVPATTGTVVPGGMTVGGQITLTCT